VALPIFSWPPRHTRFLDHTQLVTVRRTPLGWVISLSRRPLPDNTQQTNIHAAGGIRTHGRSRWVAVDLQLRPRGHWDRPYFARVVRKFTKITTIWSWIIYDFTYFIISDKHFLWNIFWTNTQSDFFPMLLGGEQNITELVRCHCYLAVYAVYREAEWVTAYGLQWVSCDKNRGTLWANVKTALAQYSTPDIPLYSPYKPL
jgi:hypothetical protein